MLNYIICALAQHPRFIHLFLLALYGVYLATTGLFNVEAVIDHHGCYSPDQSGTSLTPEQMLANCADIIEHAERWTLIHIQKLSCCPAVLLSCRAAFWSQAPIGRSPISRESSRRLFNVGKRSHTWITNPKLRTGFMDLDSFHIAATVVSRGGDCRWDRIRGFRSQARINAKHASCVSQP